MSNRPLRIGVIGAGDMGVRHLKSWLQVKGAEVVAVVEEVPERLASIKPLLETTVGLYADYRQAIRETRPDVISVCLPTSFHAPVSIYAIEHGSHVLCEKPIALSLEEADRMIEAAQWQGVLLTVGFMLRYTVAIAKLKEWIKRGAIGRPILAISENFMEVRPKILMHDRHVTGGLGDSF
ncbi:MAG: Gfo/Idh/MocA family oxidoreductase [Chloroflexota bacterium]